MQPTWASRTGLAINFSCVKELRNRVLRSRFEDEDALVDVTLEVLRQPPLPFTDLVEAHRATLAVVGEDDVEAIAVARKRRRHHLRGEKAGGQQEQRAGDRKSTRLNSSHRCIS